MPNLPLFYNVSAMLKPIEVVEQDLSNWRSLTHYQNLSSSKALPELFVSQCILQVLRALERMHKDHVIHCRVDAENVLVYKTPFGGDHFKLVNFDNARIAGSEVHPIFDKPTERLHPVVAPEIADTAHDAKRKPQLTAAVDIWSIGVLTFILRTACLPMNRESASKGQKFDAEAIVNAPQY